MSGEAIEYGHSGVAVNVSEIGPNAILQYLPVLEERLGPTRLREFFQHAHIDSIPDGYSMIDESRAADFHRAVRRQFPADARQLAQKAGSATADYIIANRIPAPAKILLRRMPSVLSERMLSRSITTHAWTFAGSGVFHTESLSPIRYTIAENPLATGENAESPICHWHAAVFQRLFSRLVGRDFDVVESDCCACGDQACRFLIKRLA